MSVTMSDPDGLSFAVSGSGGWGTAPPPGDRRGR
jgi:hypothetical protein